jgi:putative transposase
LWVADITYVKAHSGWVYASFVLDVFSRWIVGWQLSTNLYTDLALDALNMGIWTRQRNNTDLSQLIHHSDRGVQYLAIRYTERLHEVEAVASVGSVGDSYDCETVLRRSGRCDPCYEWPFGCLGVDLSAGSSDAPQVARRAGSDLIGA